MNTIFLSEPRLIGNEKKYVNDCLDTGWLSWQGKYVTAFEEEFANFCGTKYAVSTMNGTVSLQLAMAGLDIKQGDEVIIPTITYIASANAVNYLNATPVFVDCAADSWNIDVNKIEAAITCKTKAIMPVHYLGLICDMDPIIEIAKKNRLYVIEDAAESHGATYFGKRSGSFGDVNSFSFFANKIITSGGEGGMLTLNDKGLLERIRILRNQGQDPSRKYWHPVVGYNFRMTNLQAAVGLAQLECIEKHMKYRTDVAAMYDSILRKYTDLFEWQTFSNDYEHVYWSYGLLLKNTEEIRRNAIITAMKNDGIETRPINYPMHIMPPYADGSTFPVAEDIALRGLCLPSHGNLSERDIVRICGSLIGHVTDKKF